MPPVVLSEKPPSTIKQISPLEELVLALRGLAPKDTIYYVSPALPADRGGKVACLFEPVTDAAEGKVGSLTSSLKDWLQTQNLNFNPEAALVIAGADRTIVLVLPHVISTLPNGDADSGKKYMLPPHYELFPGCRRELRDDRVAFDGKLLMTGDYDCPEKVTLLLAPVGIVLTSLPFKEIKIGLPIEFFPQEMALVWSRTAFLQAAFELDAKFNAAPDDKRFGGKAEDRKLIDELKLNRSNVGSREQHGNVCDGALYRVNAADFNRRFGGSDFLAGMIYETISNQFTSQQCGEDVLIESLRFNKDGSLEIYVRYEHELPVDLQTLRVTLCTDAVAKAIWN